MRSFSCELDFVLNCNTLLLFKSAYRSLQIESLLRILCLVVVHVVASPGMLVKISRCLTVRPVARQTKVAKISERMLSLFSLCQVAMITCQIKAGIM